MDLLAEIARELAPQRIEEDEFTCRMLMDEMQKVDENVSYAQVYRALARGVRDGKYTVRKALVDGHYCQVYRKT